MSLVNCIVLWLHVLNLFDKPCGRLASKVSINQNIQGFYGKNDTHLTCSFIQEKGELEIIAKNITEDFRDKKPIAIFQPETAAKLHPSGEYLFGRVTLTTLTSMSTNATLTFYLLQCIDEKDYICKYNFFDKDGAVVTVKSKATRIIVKAKKSFGKPISAFSSKPDIISSAIISSMSRDTQFNTSINLLRDKNNTSENVDQSQPHLREWVTVIFTCTGNIGRPPGKFIWQKISPQQQTSITYSNETTEIEETPEICSFRGKSNLIIPITPEDLKAKIRCYEESQANVQGMYLETEPFDVLLDELLIVTDSNSAEISTVHAAYAIPVSFAVVIVAICFIVRTRNCKREKENIQSEVSDDHEDISENNEYEEIESISCLDINMINERIETVNQPIIEGELVLENINSSTSSGSDIIMIHSYVNTNILSTYVNTNILSTNEHLKMSVNTETVSNHPNELGNGNMEIGDTFVYNNSESDTVPVHQYVNMISTRVPNFYQDLNHTTADTHKYESLQMEGNKTFTE